MHEQTTPAAEIEDIAAPEASGSGWQATSVPGVYRRARAKTYTVRWRGPDGRQRAKGGFRTVKLAGAFLAEQRADMKRGEYTELSTVTLGEHVAGYLAGVPVEELGIETREEYQRDLQRAVDFLGAKTRLVDVTTPRLVEYAKHLRQRGGQRPAGGPLSQVSVRRVMAPLQRLLGDAAAAGVIRGNPAAAMPRARRQRNGSTRKARALSAEQLQAMIEAATEGWHRTFISFLAGTGLRVSEAIGLRWRHVDFGERTVRVETRIRKGREGATKSVNSTRDVHLSAGLARDLAALRLASTRSGADEFVFPSTRGTSMSESNTFSRVIRPAALRAGIVDQGADDAVVEWVGHHTMRHTFASHAFASGWDVLQVAHALGHADPAFTLRTYLHLIPKRRPDTSFVDALTGVGAG